jgi:hypothetical protein
MRTNGDIAAECKRSTGRLAIPWIKTPYSMCFGPFRRHFRLELTFTLGEAVQSGP